MSNPPARVVPQRAEVYWLDFDPATGHEMANRHSCIVIQNDVGNQHSNLTIVVAVTSNLRVSRLPVGVLIPAGEGGLTRDSVAHCGHIYTVDQARLGDKLGALPQNRMDEIDQAIKRSLDLR